VEKTKREGREKKFEELAEASAVSTVTFRKRIKKKGAMREKEREFLKKPPGRGEKGNKGP